MNEREFILYADDDKDDVELMNALFKDHPEYILVAFDSGMPLLDYLQTAKLPLVCLVLLDINMPNLGGLATLRLMRSDDQIKHLPVVMFSTTTSTADTKNSNLLGAEVLLKPDTDKDLHATRDRILEFCGIYTKRKLPNAVAPSTGN